MLPDDLAVLLLLEHLVGTPGRRPGPDGEPAAAVRLLIPQVHREWMKGVPKVQARYTTAAADPLRAGSGRRPPPRPAASAPQLAQTSPPKHRIGRIPADGCSLSSR